MDVALVGETGRSTRAVTRGGTASDRRTGGAINVDWGNKDKAQAALEGLHETFRAEAFLWRQVTTAADLHHRHLHDDGHHRL